MKQASFFHKGIIEDLDYSKLDNEGMVLPTSYIRLLNKEGQGLIVTPVNGNEKVFELRSGFIIFGATEFNGIAYIISYNPRTKEGEIGSFPSPATGGGFENAYKPLRNLIKHQRLGPLRSTEFNFRIQSPVLDQMYATYDYDGSVSLIFTDYHNELRLVNSGFDQEGIRNERYYRENTLADSIQLVKSLPPNQRIRFSGQALGGEMKFGNYFFFYRYVSANNDRTPFVSESSPVTITRNAFERQSVQMSGDDQKSNKKIKLNIQNLDHAFTFVEVAYIRFYSGPEGVVTPEIMKVEKLYPIPAGAVDMFVDVTGFETLLPLSISELLRPVNNEVICKSIVPYDRRFWGLNWKAKKIDYNALKDASLKIYISYDDRRMIPKINLRTFYSDPRNIHYAGYFRNEAYICGVVYKLKNGYETERFPVTGIDYRDNSKNSNGVVLMPGHDVSPVFDRDNENAHILGVRFNVSSLKSWIDLGTKEAKWFKENVSEIIFVRAKRKENLLYQGVLTRVYGRKIFHSVQQYETTYDFEGNDVSIPIYDDYEEGENYQEHNLGITGNTKGLPLVIRDPGGQNSRAFISTYLHDHDHSSVEEDCQSEQEKKTRAFFSTDFIFGDQEKIESGSGEYFVEPLWELKHIKHKTDTIRPMITRSAFDKAQSAESYGRIFKPTRISKVADRNNWIVPSLMAPLNLVNRVSDGTVSGSSEIIRQDMLCWYGGNDYFTNRNIIVPPYIGLEFGADGQHEDYSLKYPGRVCSIYRQNPKSKSAFNPIQLYSDELNIPYSRINYGTIDVEDILSGKVASVTCYQGDCFIQLTTIKIRSWYPTYEIGREEDKGEIGASISAYGFNWTETANQRRYAHGHLLDIVTENAVNTALRFNVDSENRYYPALRNISFDFGGVTWTSERAIWGVYPYSTDVTGWGKNLGSGIEAFMVNHGNSQTISIKHYLPFNPNIPKGINHFTNRIRHTGRQEAGHPILTYRVWDFANKVDFDERYGQGIKLMILAGRLISIQESSILLHQTNVEETVPSSTGEMVIGVRAILSAYPITLARFGMQHMMGAVNGSAGIYGFDWINSVFWRIIMNEDGILIARSISKEYLIDKYVKDLKNKRDELNASAEQEIFSGLKDRIISLNLREQEGIMVLNDPYNSEVIFYVSFNSHCEAMRFNEENSAFIGTFSFPMQFGFNARRHLLGTEPSETSKVYIYGEGPPATFFEKEYNPKISFVVNGIVGDQNFSMLNKMFKSLEIVAPKTPVPIDMVEFRTMFQKTKNDPFYNEEQFWLSPEYLMSKWAVPINLTEEGEEVFQEESNITGEWLKITVTLKKGLDTFIKNIITIFTTSSA